MDSDNTPFLVDAHWLQEHLHDSDLRIFDCTTHMIAQPVGASKIVSGRSDYEAGHIEGALHLDMVQDLSDPEGDYPYTMLKPSQFERLAQRLGLKKSDHVIICGSSAITTLTRAWLVFYVMGHPAVSILDGGLKAWTASAGRLSHESRPPAPSNYTVDKPRLQHIASIEDVKAASRNTKVCLLNALSREQFDGTGGAHYGRPGRIPGSRHLAARNLVDQESGQFLPSSTLAEMATGAGLDPQQPVIHYCGGGIAASTTAFVLAMLGWQNWALYDNSLLEWSTQPDTLMETT